MKLSVKTLFTCSTDLLLNFFTNFFLQGVLEHNLKTDQETWSVRFPHDKKMFSLCCRDVKFVQSKLEGFLASGFLGVSQFYVLGVSIIAAAFHENERYKLKVQICAY